MNKYINLIIILITLLIITIGNLLIFSSASGGPHYMHKQILFTCVGIILGLCTFSIPTKIFEKFTPYIYLLNLAMLISVLFLGTNINGARRWFNLGFMNFQPSELSKILIIICLSVFLFKRKDRIDKPSTFWYSLIYTAIPTLLIFKEPDLGTSIVFIAVWFIINLFLGTSFKNVIVFILIICVLSFVTWFVPGVLKPYQKERLTTFLNPEADILDSGYHVTQSKIAIGSGGMTGKGYLKGGQRALKFIPEQHTDFIFTVLGEEEGFVGGAILLILYTLLFMCFLYVALTTPDLIGKGIVVGISGMFMFQIFTNIGMTLGIMPVTGLPLILVSYGGTSLITSLMAIGIILGISYRNKQTDFF
ncbi:MAG: rod shape-determining protein RodA [Abditibacteriota bacterium]|nr:rod shape-determining protein RodA [Abditibacteriota bacterium]